MLVTVGGVTGAVYSSVPDPLVPGTFITGAASATIETTTKAGISFNGIAGGNLVLTSTGSINQTQPINMTGEIPAGTPSGDLTLDVATLNNGEANILLNNPGNDVNFVSLRALSADGTAIRPANIRFDDTDGFRITGPGRVILTSGAGITLAPVDGTVAGGVLTRLGTINLDGTTISGGGNIVLSAGRGDAYTGAVPNGVVDQTDNAVSFIQGARIGFLGNPLEYNLYGATVGASNDIQRLTAYLTEGGNLNYEDSNGFQIMSLDFRNGDPQASFIP